jgi:hypothetical protein
MENEQHFDVIKGLHGAFFLEKLLSMKFYYFICSYHLIAVKHLNDVLEKIFKYLDAESLLNAELTCKAWKAAASVVNQKKLWKLLLKKKVRFNLFNGLMIFNLSIFCFLDVKFTAVGEN